VSWKRKPLKYFVCGNGCVREELRKREVRNGCEAVEGRVGERRVCYLSETRPRKLCIWYICSLDRRGCGSSSDREQVGKVLWWSGLLNLMEV